MLKVIRWLLYGLAILSGGAGLYGGGVPLAKYAFQRLRDPGYGYYFAPDFLFPPEAIFLLSLLLLMSVRIGFAIEKGIRPADVHTPVASRNQPNDSASANEIARPSKTVETSAPDAETADEKLTRLLNQKKH